MLPGRGLPSHHRDERDEGRCCISSSADGRILRSFPSLSHPLSLRPIPEVVSFLDRFDSETTDTAVAQVGRAISPVPSSQKIDNAKWHKLLHESSSPVSSDVAVEGSRLSVENRVSPGVSEIRRLKQDPQSPDRTGGSLPGELDRDNLRKPRDSSKLPSSSDTSQILSRYEEFIARLRRLERPDTPVHSNPTSEHAVEANIDVGQLSDDTHTREGGTAYPAVYNVQTNASLPFEANKQGLDSLVTGDGDTAHLNTTPPNYSSAQEVLAVRQGPAVSEKSDPDDAWKSFVFGNEGSEELGQAAFEDARHEAIGNLQQSTSPAFLDDRPDSDANSNSATVGTLIAPPYDEPSDPVDAHPLNDAFSSLEAAYHESEPAMDISSPAHAPSVEVNAGSSNVSVANAIGSSDVTGPGSVQSKESILSEPCAGPPSVTTSLAVAPARSHVASSETGTPGEYFRFVQPKSFVGRRSNAPQPNLVGGPGVGITLSKRKRGRPKKRANDGRADIRALPNYNSDPIEEFEDEERPPQIPLSRARAGLMMCQGKLDTVTSGSEYTKQCRRNKVGQEQ
ncbi:uncharacterized protein B0T15DRAFT_94773 [Chaetomium strumarium]|uniref:Uncharacterized protein n=1 Tax=Chaetomium strumarium TaxID=1170767 RepID=A0AAJ0GXK8_9PEZI|nr:hypothetical protein B0T15DRAFT_94773 [Chaetomium strumarium]